MGIASLGMGLGILHVEGDPGDPRTFVLIGLVSAASGAAFIKPCVRIATQRTEVYEHGFVARSLFGTVSARFEDLAGILRSAINRSAVLTTMVRFQLRDGRRVSISREVFANRPDDEMTIVIDNSCNDLALRWLSRIERARKIPWLEGTSNPC
jgi:hypothetical protein